MTQIMISRFTKEQRFIVKVSPDLFSISFINFNTGDTPPSGNFVVPGLTDPAVVLPRRHIDLAE